MDVPRRQPPPPHVHACHHLSALCAAGKMEARGGRPRGPPCSRRARPQPRSLPRRPLSPTRLQLGPEGPRARGVPAGDKACLTAGWGLQGRACRCGTAERYPPSEAFTCPHPACGATDSQARALSPRTQGPQATWTHVWGSTGVCWRGGSGTWGDGKGKGEGNRGRGGCAGLLPPSRPPFIILLPFRAGWTGGCASQRP